MLIDVPGVHLGHVSLSDTGVTALVAADPRGMLAAVDVRGGGPGTRETDLLAPHNTVERVNAILLCGGSAFGLAAADGAMRELERRGLGFAVFGDAVPDLVVPIVPAAVIFDLAVGDPAHRPTAADGAAVIAHAIDATDAAGSREKTGSVGVGCGATAGVLRGGFGAGVTTAAGYTVAAYVAANPVGSVIDPYTGLFYGDASLPPVDLERFGQLRRPMPKLNTTIGVIVTDAPLGPAALKRLAMTGHDGIARAIRPAHSPLDGDALFAVSVAETSGAGGGEVVGDVEKRALLGEAAANMVQAAIVDAVASATPAHGVTAWRELAR